MIDLLDDASGPMVRQTIGQLLSAATTADLAVANVRLAAVDLQPDEMTRLKRLRVLLSRFDASFAADARALALDVSQLQQLHGLLRIVESERVEVRCVGALRWTPDFSVFRGLADDRQDVLLIGAHYFRPLFSTGGAALTCVVRDAAAVARAARRFEDLWELAHDVRDVIAETLSDTLACAGSM